MRLLSALTLAAITFAPCSVQAQGEWRTQIVEATARYEAARAKLRDKFDKNLQNLERREKDFLALARDEWGRSEAASMDPQAFTRGAEARRRFVDYEDSSAVRFVAARRTGDLAPIRRGLAQRLADAQAFIVQLDTAVKYAREMRKQTQKSLDNLRAEDKPGANQNRRNYIKKLLDYYEKLDRVASARATFYDDYADMLRKELGLIEQEIVLTSR